MPAISDILIVEDDRNYKDFYRKLLQPHFNIDIASTKRSHAVLANKNYRAVVTNCYSRRRNRLRTDGFSLLRFARAQGCIAPFIFIAEARDKYINWEGDTYGAFDILQKRKSDFHTHLLSSLRVASDFYVYQTERNTIDREISEYFSRIPYVTPICWDYKDQTLFETFFEKDGRISRLNGFCYANNWMYICQAARQNGHKFFDGKVLITIEAHKKDGDYQFEIIRPLGQNAAKKSFELAETLKEFTKHPVMIKRLEPDQFNSLLDRGCQIYNKPKSTRLEDFYDDIYPQVVIDLKSFLYNMSLPQMAWFRRGLRQFTKRNYTIKDLKPHLYKDMREAILRWKRSFVTRYKNKTEFSEVPERDTYYLDPYLPFVEYFGQTNQNDTVATIVYVDDEPVGFSVLGRVSDACMAMYANVGDTDCTGLSYFMLYQNFLRALWSGYSYINLGGTETKSLYDFYCRLSGMNPDGAGGESSESKNRLADETSDSVYQSVSLSWKDLTISDLDRELTSMKETLSQKKGRNLDEHLNNLNLATLLEKIAHKRKDVKILASRTFENQKLERKYLVYHEKKDENKSPNGGIL